MVPKGMVCVRCLPVPQQPHVLHVLVGNRATAVGDTQVNLLGMGTCLLALPPEDDAYRFAQRLPIKQARSFGHTYGWQLCLGGAGRGRWGISFCIFLHPSILRVILLKAYHPSGFVAEGQCACG